MGSTSSHHHCETCSIHTFDQDDLHLHEDSVHHCQYCKQVTVANYHELQVHLLTECTNFDQLAGRTRGMSRMDMSDSPAAVRKKFVPAAAKMEGINFDDDDTDSSEDDANGMGHKEGGSGGGSGGKGHERMVSLGGTAVGGGMIVGSGDGGMTGGVDVLGMGGDESGGYAFGAPEYYEYKVNSDDPYDPDDVHGASTTICCSAAICLLRGDFVVESKTLDDIVKAGLQLDAHEHNIHFGHCYMRPDFIKHLEVPCGGGRGDVYYERENGGE